MRTTKLLMAYLAAFAYIAFFYVCATTIENPWVCIILLPVSISILYDIIRALIKKIPKAKGLSEHDFTSHPFMDIVLILAINAGYLAEDNAVLAILGYAIAAIDIIRWGIYKAEQMFLN